MTVVIMQPGYLPWLGFFDLMKRSDVFVIYDDVQYTKNDWRNRNKVKTSNGTCWLTVPVEKKKKAIKKDYETCKTLLKDVRRLKPGISNRIPFKLP